MPVIAVWYVVWMTCFFVAGSAFAVIAAIVTVRGIGDLRQMLRDLRANRRR